MTTATRLTTQPTVVGTRTVDSDFDDGPDTVPEQGGRCTNGLPFPAHTCRRCSTPASAPFAGTLCHPCHLALLQPEDRESLGLPNAPVTPTAAATLVVAQSVYNAAMDALLAVAGSHTVHSYQAALKAIKAPYTAAVQAALDADAAMDVPLPIVLVPAEATPVVKPALIAAQAAYREACAAAKAQEEVYRNEYTAAKAAMHRALSRLDTAKRDTKAAERAAYLALKAAERK